MNWADYLDWGAREDPHKPLVHCEGTTLTYGQMRRWTNQLGHALSELGVRRGDRVATYLASNPLHEAVLIGSLKLAAIGCPLSLREKPATMIGALRELEAAVLVVGADQLGFAQLARAELPGLRIVSAGGRIPGFESLDDAASAAPTDLRVAAMRETDYAFIGFTAGTTKRPKGVPVTARMLRAHNTALFERFALGRASEVWFGLVSFGHVGGIAIGLAPAYLVGASHVLLPRWDPAEALRLIEKHRVTYMTGPMTMIQQMAKHEAFATTDFSSLKVAISGGEPCPVKLKEHWGRVTGCRLCEGYGMSEATVGVLQEDPRDVGVSSGRPLDRIEEVRLVDPVTRRTIEGPGTGELAVRGDHVTPGYWRNPEETASKFDSEGWFYSGDLCRRDEDGLYYTLGRVDAMFQSGGENVYPSEVEAALVDHPAVAKAFCFPEPHQEWTKVSCAAVELRPGASATPEEVVEFCASHPTLARFKRPRRVFIVEALPIGATGKIVRRELKEQLAAMGYHADI